ncbi:MAG: alpha-(1-_3)-arabinofuranosyltransferase family protein, partial [Actinomycetota bacterium]
MNSFESRLQDGWYEPQSLKPFANLISASHVIQRNDLEHERYRTPRPDALVPVIESTPPGDLLFRGPQQKNMSSVPLIDSQTYAHERSQNYPSVVAWNIADSRPLLDAQPAGSTVVLSGDGEGLVDALNANLIEPRRPIIYADTIHQRELGDISRTSSIQILTDTNRRAARRWYSVGSNTGKTDGAKTEALRKDPSDNRLMPFIADHDLDVSPDSQTVSELVGDIASVRATNYGNPVTFTPEDRPENAVDGDPRTAWRTAVFQSSRNEALEITLRRKVTTDRITLELPTTGVTARKITKFSITLDGSASPILSSFGKGNSVTVTFASQSFTRVLIRVLSDSYGARTSFSAAPGVGIAEVKIGGVSSTEYFRLPVTRVSDAPSTFLLTRRRIDQATPNRFDPETNISRIFSTTTPTAFSISGDVRVSGLAKDAVINQLIGADPLVFASRRTQGSPSSFGLSAVDGDQNTFWTTPIDASIGAQLNIALGDTNTRRLRFAFINDNEHSIPTTITITGTGGSSQVQVPKPDETGNSVVNLPATIQAPITSIVIDEIAAKTSPDYFSGFPRVLPVSVREIDTGAHNELTTRKLSVLCHSDLLWIDDVAVGVLIKGSVSDALNRQTLELSLCDNSFMLGAGKHTLRTALGEDVGFDLDRIILQPKTRLVKASVPAAQTTILSRGTTHLEAQVTATGPTIVSFAYSINPGWKATYRPT